MAEVFTTFRTAVIAEDGRTFVARACGGPADYGIWEGWVEFVANDNGEVVRTERETTQPNRTDLAYWATGLEPIYLEGALSRALRRTSRESPSSIVDEAAAQETELAQNPLRR